MKRFLIFDIGYSAFAVLFKVHVQFRADRVSVNKRVLDYMLMRQIQDSIICNSMDFSLSFNTGFSADTVNKPLLGEGKQDQQRNNDNC